MNFIIQKDEYFSTLYVDPGPSFVNATNITNISDSVIKFQNIIIDSATFVPEPVPTGNDLPLGINKKLFLDDFDDQLKLIDSNGNIEFTSFDQNLNRNSAAEFQMLVTPELFTDTITQQAINDHPNPPAGPNSLILYTRESNTPGKPDLFYRTTTGNPVNLSSQATGNPFDQPLNTFNDVIFNSIETSQIQPNTIVNPNIVMNTGPNGSVQIVGQALECSTLRGIGGISGSAVADATINNINPTTQTSKIGDINPYTEIHTNNLYTNNIKGNGPGPSSLNIDDFSTIDLNSSGNTEFTGNGKVSIAKTDGLEITTGGLDITSGGADIIGNANITGNVIGSGDIVGTGNVIGNQLVATSGGANITGNIQMTGNINNVINITTGNNNGDIGLVGQRFNDIFVDRCNTNEVLPLPAGTDKRLGSSSQGWENLFTKKITAVSGSDLLITFGPTQPLIFNTLSGTESKIKMLNLPTSDPGVLGQLWNDAGTLKISSGPPP